MKKLLGIVVLSLLLIHPVFTSQSFAEKYAVENPDRFDDEKYKELDCNLGKNNPSKTDYWGPVEKSKNIDTDWYHSSAWGLWSKRAAEYIHGKSLGVCVNKNGTGFYYTAAGQYSTKKKKNQSWVNITSHIGKRAWVWEAGNVYGNSNKDFPVEIGQVKKLRVIYDYNFKSKGQYNNNISIWIRKFDEYRPYIEVMLKFDATARKHTKKKLKNLRTDNYEFDVYSTKGVEFKRKDEGLDYFFSIDAFEKYTKINKKGDYFIDIDLKHVFDYLLEKKLINYDDILPGFEVTTEIWDGAGEMKIKKLKYEIEIGEGKKLVYYIATAKNKKDDLFQMKSRRYSSASEAEKDVMERCKMFFEPYGKNKQKACYIYSIDKE